jgi:broad specificity phosphatase PhoE
MVEVQAWVLAPIERLCLRQSSLTLALVGHADVIRVALTYGLGMSLDLLLRLEVVRHRSVCCHGRYGAARSLYQQHGRIG